MTRSRIMREVLEVLGEASEPLSVEQISERIREGCRSARRGPRAVRSALNLMFAESGTAVVPCYEIRRTVDRRGRRARCEIKWAIYS